MSTDGFAITRGARREILLRGPLTEQQLGASDEEVAYLDAHREIFGQLAAAQLDPVSDEQELELGGQISRGECLALLHP